MATAPLDLDAVARVIAPFGSSATLPAAAYTDPAVLAWEQEHLFSTTWVCVGRVDSLLDRGQIRAVRVGAESVLLVRGGDGELRAFSNVCRHRGHELAPVGAAIDARLIRCPYHSWSYRFDGTLRSAPSLTQTETFELADYPLIPVATAVYLGFVWVDLSGTAPPIGEHFGNLAEKAAPYRLDRIVAGASHSYEVAANWKIVAENYNECYHCGSIHPALCDVSPPDSGLDHEPTGVWCGGTMELRDHAETMSIDGSSGGVMFADVVAPMNRKVFYLTVVPNLLLSMHPDYVMTHRLTPLGVDRTEVECTWLFPPEASEIAGFDPAYAVDFWDTTNREDWAACEAVQRGAGNRGFRPGPLSPWEGTVYQFLGIVARAYLGQGMVVPTVPIRELRP